MLLEGKVALITGSASGIGRATAKLFAAQGAKIVVADINKTGGENTVSDIIDGGGEALFVATDLAKVEDVKSMVDTAMDSFGRLDVIHSNAAAFDMGTAAEITEDQWDRTVSTCLKTTWMITHHAAPLMLTSGGGTFVITGSDHAIRGYPGYAAYQAAKGGLLAMTRSLAADCAPIIRVNIILPGAVETEIWGETTSEERDRIADMCILKRNGRPEDIASVALFLASDMSSYMTGAHIVVDGGFSSVMQMPETE